MVFILSSREFALVASKTRAFVPIFNLAG